MENEMKGKVMGVDAANRRKNAKLKVTASGGANPGANLRPLSKLAPKGSIRPRTRSDKEAEDAADAAADRAMKHSQPPKLVYKAMGGKLKMVEKDGKKVPAFAADGVGKMAMGGKCRGMGSASKGGSYSKNG
jgi:hypothetical protein